jgi:hypothetical protein
MGIRKAKDGRGQTGRFRVGINHGLLVAVLNFDIDLLAMHRHVGGSFDAQFNEVAFQSHNSHDYPAINDNAFTRFA